ncbi:MAG: ribonuclease R [Gammaproteobacteria bacterium]|nr:ribonuclease R [Gammaproteobacteria bacterium]
MEAILKQDKSEFETIDPYAQREAENYEKPIPSREYLLKLLEQEPNPVSWESVADTLGLKDEDRREGVRRRLIAMSRDGQIVSNRSGDFGVLDKMSLVRGHVIGHRDGFGFVSPGGGSEDLFLSHRQMRKVLDGDEVLARTMPGNYRGKREGAVVRVLKHNTQQLAGRVFRNNGISFVRPESPRITLDVMVPEDKIGGACNGQYVVVNITAQPSRNSLPQGEITEVLGDHLAPGMEITVAIRNGGLPHAWPAATLEETESIAAEVTEADKKARIDLRQLPLVTIDGKDARDFDDAVYCQVLPDQGWKLLVAIADVSHYVQTDSALDEEARNRGNSVYFPDFVLPMLPEKLSNGLCSLNPHVDRLCMVCEMHINQQGGIDNYQFFEGVMRSHERLTYTQVGEIMATRDNTTVTGLRQQFSALVPHLDNLQDLYHALRGARDARGAIDFETTETRIIFDDQRKIARIVPVVRNDAHKLIEECMLAANVCAAELMAEAKLPMLYRVHDLPKTQKLSNLREYLGELGLRLEGGDKPRPKDYQTLLQSVQDRADAHIIQTMLLRSMNQAVYQPENRGHFGLDYPAYAHFTSPIRRYPDLLLHRGLRWLLHNGSANKPAVANRLRRTLETPTKTNQTSPYSPATMQMLGEHCSMTERRADDATRDVISWLKCEYLQEHVGEVYTGVISAVTGFGLFVELDELYVEGLIHVTALPKDYYRFEQAQQRLVGERSGARYRLGDLASVQVVRVDLDERKVDLTLETLLPQRKTKLRNTPRANQHKATVPRENTSSAPKAPSKNTEPNFWNDVKLTQHTPFRKRKVGSTDAEPVAASVENHDSATQQTPAENNLNNDTISPPKKRGPRRTPTRKGGKRPSVAARKAAHKASTKKKSAKQKTSSKKKK